MSETPPAPAPSQPPLDATEAAAPGASRGLRLGFVGHVNVVFLTYVTNAVLALGVQVLLARALGTDGRGAYALFLLTASITQAVLSLGLNVSSVYYLSKGAYPLSRVVANAQHVTLAAAAVTTALVLAAWPVLGGTFGEHGVPYWAFAFVVPLFLAYNVYAAVLQGLSRFLAMNAVVLLQPVVMLTLLGAGFALGDVGTAEALVFWSAATLSAVLLSLVLLGRDALRPAELLRIDLPSLREQARFGLQGQFGNLVQILNYRFDQYIVLLFAGTSSVGVYVVGVSASQSVWFLANAVAAVLLPRLTAADADEASRTAPIVCRNTLLLSALGALALGGVSPWIVPAFFGGDFRDSVAPLLWLLPGTVALAGSKVLSSYIFSQGRPLTNTAITVAAMGVTLVADFALIPAFGASGAAIASSLAYGAHFAFSLLAYRRLSGHSILEAVVIRGEDLRRYVEIARARLAMGQA